MASIGSMYENHSFRQPLHRQLLHIRHARSIKVLKIVIKMLKDKDMRNADMVTVNDFMLTVTKGFVCNSYVLKELRRHDC